MSLIRFASSLLLALVVIGMSWSVLESVCGEECCAIVCSPLIYFDLYFYYIGNKSMLTIEFLIKQAKYKNRKPLIKLVFICVFTNKIIFVKIKVKKSQKFLI